MKKNIVMSTKYKKDIKAYKHNKVINTELRNVLDLLMNNQTLPEKYRDHDLHGNYSGCRDCHIKPNVILIYEIHDDYIGLIRFGSHNKLGLTENILLHLKDNI